MNYCSNCGTAVVVRIPEGEHLPRHVCPACHTVHYQNPKLVVGCIPEDEHGRIVMCRRAIEPRHGYWTFPAGFMENNETLQQQRRASRTKKRWRMWKLARCWPSCIFCMHIKCTCFFAPSCVRPRSVQVPKASKPV